VKTVRIFPTAIFFVSVILLILSSILLACVRLPKIDYSTNAEVNSAEEDPEEPTNNSHRTGARTQEATLVEADA
jgi:hypothetical protein